VDLNSLLKVIENLGDVEFLDANQLARAKPVKVFLNGIARLEAFSAGGTSPRIIGPTAEEGGRPLDQSAGS
jgi:hypothetical protein